MPQKKRLFLFLNIHVPQMQRDDWMNLNGKWDYVGGKDVIDATTCYTATLIR
jgi:hypothetical protein